MENKEPVKKTAEMTIMEMWLWMCFPALIPMLPTPGEDQALRRHVDIQRQRIDRLERLLSDQGIK